MQTIGERLEEARKKKGISIREAAEATKIRGDYLGKFESNHFDIGLTELYVRGFLRSYALFLRLPAERILNDYAALGRGEAKPRQPSREIYGRMDVSISSAEERGEGAPPPAEEPSPAAAPARRVAHVPRRGGHADAGTGIDPALVFKFGKWAGAVVVAILVIWAVATLFKGNPAATTARPATQTAAAPANPPAPAPAEPSITLVALDTVRVTVIRKNADGTDGEQLFQGTLLRGQTQVVPKPGPIYVTASAAENLEIELRGKRYPTGYKGFQKLQMP